MVARENRLRAFQDFPLVKTTPDWWGVEGRLEKAWDVPCSCPSPHTSSLEDGVNNGDVSSARESLSRSPQGVLQRLVPTQDDDRPGPQEYYEDIPVFLLQLWERVQISVPNSREGSPHSHLGYISGVA